MRVKREMKAMAFSDSTATGMSMCSRMSRRSKLRLVMSRMPLIGSTFAFTLNTMISSSPSQKAGTALPITESTRTR